MNDNKLYNVYARTIGIVMLGLIGAVWLIVNSPTLRDKVTVNGTMIIIVYIVSFPFKKSVQTALTLVYTLYMSAVWMNHSSVLSSNWK